jgi:hypothetical protein
MTAVSSLMPSPGGDDVPPAPLPSPAELEAEAEAAGPDGLDPGLARLLEAADGVIGPAEETLRELDAALDRLARGSYGTCRRCGVTIESALLAVAPLRTTCEDCAGAASRAAPPAAHIDRA